MSTVEELGRLAAQQQVLAYKANDPSMRILKQGPVLDKDFLYHASGKKFDLLDPSYNSKKSYGHEYGVPVVFAGDAPSSAFASNPTAEYQDVKNKINNSVYHRLIDEMTGRKALLGHTPGGYLYKLPASAFTQIDREDNELGKWTKSTEYVSNRAVKPISVTAMKSTDVDAIPEYEYLGEDFVGEMPAQQYLKRAKNPKVIAAIKAWLNNKGRASLKAQGHDIKRPQPEGGARKYSFCTRMGDMKAKRASAETANDPYSRINEALRKWKCGSASTKLASLLKNAACWKGYERVPGTKAMTPGSCRPVGGKKKEDKPKK